MTIPDDVLTDRFAGCLIGGAIGDCLGRPYEGKPGPIAVTEPRRWAVSDDTELTLTTCEAIIEAGGVDPEAVARAMTDAHRKGRLSGIGASTLKALSDLSAGGHWATSGRRGAMAAGNGAAMRIAPLAFFLDPQDKAARKTIRDTARITHHSDEAYAGALAVCLCVSRGRGGSWKGGPELIERLPALLPDTSVRDRIDALLSEGPNISIADAARRYGCSGYVVESVPLAIFAASRLSRLGFAEVLREIISAGGDTDTNASMAGQIMGCAIGMANLPLEMTEQIPCLSRINVITSALAGLVGCCRA